MRQLRVFGFPALLGLILSFASVARADLLFDNLGAASDGSNGVANAFGGPLGDSFSTGAAAVLVDVKFLLSGDPTNLGSTSVDLYTSDESTSSPTLGTFVANLGTINDAMLTPSFGVVDVSGFTPIDLSANTRWWILLSSTDSSAVWSYALDTLGPGVVNEFYYYNGASSPNSTGPFQMQVNVNVAAVPEPSTRVVFLCGIGAFFVLRRRLVR